MDVLLTRSGAISTHAQPPAQDEDLFGCSIIIQYLHQIEMRQHVMRHLILQVHIHRVVTTVLCSLQSVQCWASVQADC
jgi:hypothetical protein